MRDEVGAKFCRTPCSNFDDFIYDDQSCHRICPLPLKIEVGNYCKSPCLAETQFVNSNGSCQDSCEYPARIVEMGSYKICQIDFKRAQSDQIFAMREMIKISNTLSELGGVLSCLISSGDPTSIFMVPLLEIFQKTTRASIVLPRNTEFILTQNSFNGRVLIVIIFAIMALFISGILKLTEAWNESKFYQLLVKCDSILRWNTLIPLFMVISGDLIEFQKSGINSSREILCGLLTILIFSKIYMVIRRRREEEMPRWRFLFNTVSENQRFFILIYFGRMILYHLIIGLLDDYPSFQAFLMILLSFGMCFYLIWLSPVKKNISKIQYLIVESALLFYNFIFGILAVFDVTESSAVDVFGQLMNILYLIPSVLTAVLIILKIMYIIYSYSKVSGASQSNHIQLSEMNHESDLDSPPQSVRFEPLNQEEMAPSYENTLGKTFQD